MTEPRRLRRSGRRAAMGAAVRGQAATLDQAVAAAAQILRAARQPLIAGLGTCAAGAFACVELARAVGGVLDHGHAGAALRGLQAVRQSASMTTTPPELRARADLVLLVGEGILLAWPDAVARLGLHAPPPLAPDAGRRLLRLCPGADQALAPGSVTLGRGPGELPVLLGAIRALLAGRRLRLPGARRAALEGFAQALQAAHYGVAIWADAGLDALSAEMLHGLIDDLNAVTRFAALPLPAPGNVAGVAQAVTATAGFPLRVGFGRGAAEHDPWRFDAARLIESGEADAVLWVSALDSDAPPWARAVPTVALHGPAPRFLAPPEVTIPVGRPGADHDAVLFDPGLAALAAVSAPAGADAPPSVAEVVTRILAAVTSAC